MNITDDKSDSLKKLDDFRISAAERIAYLKEFAAKGQIVSDMPESVCEIDLHCHSFYSDGYCSPTMRVAEAFRRGMKALAISDHDVFDGQLEAIEAGKILGVRIVPAIEFYTDRPGIEIIGHFPDVNRFEELLRSKRPDEIIEPIRKAKKVQLEKMLNRIPECFAKYGMQAEVVPEDIDLYLRNGISTKGDISVIMWQKYGKELAERGLASDVKEFQAKYTTNDNELNMPLITDIDLSPEAFIKRILQWGGIPGLSHPTELRKKEGLDNNALIDTIEHLGAVGLQSIEVDGFRNGICPETGIHQTELFDRVRKEYNTRHKGRLSLLFTNGSDDHNQPDEGLELGCGKNRNLNPAFGKISNIYLLEERTEYLWGIINT